MSVLTLSPIGHVTSPFKGRFGTPRQPGLVKAAQGRLIFSQEFRDPAMLNGLEAFSHIWLTFYFDRVAEEGWKPQVRPPRLGGNEKVGVWATRSPYRPNSLGLSVVKLDRIDWESENGPELCLSGLDLTDGTPILDIKPYVAYSDSVEPTETGFVDGRPEFLPVTVTESCLKTWAEMDEGERELIEQTLACNPAPAFHDVSEARQYRMEIVGWHVEWQSEEEGQLVTLLRPE